MLSGKTHFVVVIEMRRRLICKHTHEMGFACIDKQTFTLREHLGVTNMWAHQDSPAES